MNIKALPSMGQRLFCCICFVESAVCSTFAERIIRGCLGGALVSSAPTKLYCSISCYVGVHLATLVHLRQVHPLKAPPEDTNKTLKQMT